MLVIPTDVIEKLNDGYFLIVKEPDMITVWRMKDGNLQNKSKYKSSASRWVTIKYLILPVEAKYSFRKLDEKE